MAPPAPDLQNIARQAMRENGFSPDVPDLVAAEIGALHHAPRNARDARDMRGLPWSSLDNRESRDLDQIELVETLAGGDVRVRVAIADVDALVPRGSAADAHAALNTCSVYTGVVVFPMLPERLSTDLTSLNEGEDRLAIVIEMVVAHDGRVKTGDVYRAIVRNHAKLDYDEVGAWLDGRAPAPARVADVDGLEEQLLVQNDVGERLRALRYARGALDLETIEARPVTHNGKIIDLKLVEKSRSRELIEDFMIAANGEMARFLEHRKSSTVRRVVRSPERWARIADLARVHGEELPTVPSAPALARFLASRRHQDRAAFADLSLAVVKLMGPGEYALERAGVRHTGHFGLAVQDYTHSTAPNRRFADLVTQRLLKACAAGRDPAYTDEELAEIAARCTAKENDARKVERFMRKVAAALLLSDRVGDVFDAIVTGVNAKGTFVRLEAPPTAEGRVVRGEQGLDVGDILKVKLVATEPRRGFIDFWRA
jgi:VacB/RNase II family 3'-5' exoribonuclease